MIPHDIPAKFHTTVDGLNVKSVMIKPTDTAQASAESCGRQEVTAEWYIEHGFNHDMQLFRWVEGQDEHGLDPWRLIDGPYDLKPGTRIFVQVRDLKKAGFVQ